MNPRHRHAVANAFVACFAFLLATFLLAGIGQAQEKPPADTPPSPKPTTEPQKLGKELDRPEIIINSDLVTLTVTVTDPYGRYVSGLNKSAFAVFDEKLPQDISFFSDDDAPVSVGVIFDVSGSMGGDKIRRAREALARFIQTSHNADEYFLIAFNSRALLLISDGQDNDSRYTFSEVRRLLKESDVVLYSIGILGGSDAGSSLGMDGHGILDELSNVSGGKAFFPRTNAEMDDIFEQIALELRHQYSIGYKPTNFSKDGRWHHIKVKITPPRGLPRLFVRSKEGYYSLTGSK